MKFRLDQEASIAGSSLKGTFEAKYSDLERVFGKPIKADGYKVSGEWIFRSDEGKIFTVYDWKETSLYDPSYPTVKDFRENTMPATFHVGGQGNADEFIEAITRRLENADS